MTRTRCRSGRFVGPATNRHLSAVGCRSHRSKEPIRLEDFFALCARFLETSDDIFVIDYSYRNGFLIDMIGFVEGLLGCFVDILFFCNWQKKTICIWHHLRIFSNSNLQHFGRPRSALRHYSSYHVQRDGDTCENSEMSLHSLARGGNEGHPAGGARALCDVTHSYLHLGESSGISTYCFIQICVCFFRSNIRTFIRS